MSPADFRQSIDFIAEEVFPRMGIGPEHFLTVEYLGGEILLIPDEELRDNVRYARARFQNHVRTVRDGAQSNLIGSKRRVLDLHDLFEGNLGTSWDQHGTQRQIKGSPELYRAILNNSLSSLEQERGHKTGRVLVLDKETVPHVEDEVAKALRDGYDLTLRPAFQGGSQEVNHAEINEINRAMRTAYLLWSKSKEVRIEPFTSLHHRRANRGSSQAAAAAGCPFQADCAFRSLSLDPDGTLHICQEMADSSNYPLGNAMTGVFDEKTWRLLSRRQIMLNDECSTCEWKAECGGGCMNEAILHQDDPFARTELCPVWKTIFRSIEEDLVKTRSRARDEST